MSSDRARGRHRRTTVSCHALCDRHRPLPAPTARGAAGALDRAEGDLAGVRTTGQARSGCLLGLPAARGLPLQGGRADGRRRVRRLHHPEGAPQIRKLIGVKVEAEDFDASPVHAAAGSRSTTTTYSGCAAQHPDESLEQIASRLGCSLSTVKRHLRRAGRRRQVRRRAPLPPTCRRWTKCSKRSSRSSRATGAGPASARSRQARPACGPRLLGLDKLDRRGVARPAWGGSRVSTSSTGEGPASIAAWRQ